MRSISQELLQVLLDQDESEGDPGGITLKNGDSFTRTVPDEDVLLNNFITEKEMSKNLEGKPFKDGDSWFASQSGGN